MVGMGKAARPNEAAPTTRAPSSTNSADKSKRSVKILV